MNQTVFATNIECTMVPESNNNMKCEFTDDQGITKEIDNVAFYYVDILHPQFGVHREENTGEMVIAVNSDRFMMCDIMGENERGLTVHCRD